MSEPIRIGSRTAAICLLAHRTASRRETMNSVSILQRVFERETASLAQYLVQITPWAGPEQSAAKELVERIAAEERQWCERLAELIDRRDGVPLPGSFPSSYSSLHYVAISAVLPRLCDYLRRNIEELKRDIDQAGGDREAQELLKQMLARKEAQLREAEQLVPRLRKAG